MEDNFQVAYVSQKLKPAKHVNLFHQSTLQWLWSFLLSPPHPSNLRPFLSRKWPVSDLPSSQWLPRFALTPSQSSHFIPFLFFLLFFSAKFGFFLFSDDFGSGFVFSPLNAFLHLIHLVASPFYQSFYLYVGTCFLSEICGYGLSFLMVLIHSRFLIWCYWIWWRRVFVLLMYYFDMFISSNSNLLRSVHWLWYWFISSNFVILIADCDGWFSFF